MNKSTSNFIENINKSSGKPIEYIDAFTGKRVHPGDELNITMEDVYYIVASTLAIGFITYLVVG